MRAAGPGLLLGCALLAGCSHLDRSPSQPVRLQAVDATGQARDGLHCELANDKGRWHVVLPGSVTVQRSAQPLHIACVDGPGPTTPVVSTDVAASDERGARARQAGTRMAWVGVVGTIAFLGTPTVSSGAVVYLATGAAAAAAAFAGAQRARDQAQGTGHAYPAQIELRLTATAPAQPASPP